MFIARSRALAARALGGEVVIMSPASSLFTLNEVGSAIWQAADGRTELASIVQRISQEFDVDPQAAEQDAREFVSRLAAQGLLIVSPEPIADGR